LPRTRCPRRSEWGFEEKRNRHLKDVRFLLQSAGADTVCSFLVFLHLLERQAECSSKLGLAHRQHLVPLVRETGRPAKANLSLDAGLLAAIDEAAAAPGLTRSAFLASAARALLRRSWCTSLAAASGKDPFLLSTVNR
jgi:hypothetical protein